MLFTVLKSILCHSLPILGQNILQFSFSLSYFIGIKKEKGSAMECLHT